MQNFFNAIHTTNGKSENLQSENYVYKISYSLAFLRSTLNPFTVKIYNYLLYFAKYFELQNKY